VTSTESQEVRSFSSLFIGGKWCDPSGDEVLRVTSPSTEREVASVPMATPADVDAAVLAARRAYENGEWSKFSPGERAEAMNRVADEIEVRLPELNYTFTSEIGIPTGLAAGFNLGAVGMWRGAAELLTQFEFSESRPDPTGHATVDKVPVGVVGAIIPWNAPLGNASIKLTPALAAGCTVVLKPAPEGPVSPQILAEAIEAAGIPEGVVNVVPGGRDVGEHLAKHPDVNKITFTGSTAAGKRIMSLCADRIARVTLEMGGKSAAIIADDVDLTNYLDGIVQAGVQHSGQVCAALTRIVVPAHRQDEIVEQISAVLESLQVGDPMDPSTDLGPLAAERQRTRVEDYIALGKQEGARLVSGGRRPKDLHRGWYVEPTLFAGVDNRMRIAQEEIFGPVLCVIPFVDVDHAVRIANDSPYGLSGAVYSEDQELGERIAKQIQTGQMWINGWGMCVTQPFGGFKESGLGREGGVEGLNAFLEPRFTWRPAT
jgi:aldehyde dehydrogenase (NAD+)